MKKFIAEGNHTVKVGNHPHTQLVRLKEKRSKIIYIHDKQLRIHKTIRCKI